MNTKLEHIISTLPKDDFAVILSLIPTKLLGGSIKHVQYLQKILEKSPSSTATKNIPVEDRLIMSDLCRMIEKYIVINQALSSTEFMENHFCRIIEAVRMINYSVSIFSGLPSSVVKI